MQKNYFYKGGRCVMKKGFCEKCNNLVEYKIKEIDDKVEIKGKEYNQN